MENMDYTILLMPIIYGFVAGFWIGGLSYLKNSVLSADDTTTSLFDKLTSEKFDKKRFIITAIGTGAIGGFLYFLVNRGLPIEIIYAVVPLAFRESMSNIIQIATGLNKGGKEDVPPSSRDGQPIVGSVKPDTQPIRPA